MLVRGGIDEDTVTLDAAMNRNSEKEAAQTTTGVVEARKKDNAVGTAQL